MAVMLFHPKRHVDARGWFAETFNVGRFRGLGFDNVFRQDNHAVSYAAGTLRGLHYQEPPYAQSKLIRCIRGRVFDVAVDVRPTSPTFRQWVSSELSAENGNLMFVPDGFAHGYLTLEPDCEVVYKVDAPYSLASEGGVIWNDPELAINWPLDGAAPLLSDKDAHLPMLSEINPNFEYDDRPMTPLIRIEL